MWYDWWPKSKTGKAEAINIDQCRHSKRHPLPEMRDILSSWPLWLATRKLLCKPHMARGWLTLRMRLLYFYFHSPYSHLSSGYKRKYRKHPKRNFIIARLGICDPILNPERGGFHFALMPSETYTNSSVYYTLLPQKKKKKLNSN